jgi:hypothetical protein
MVTKLGRKSSNDLSGPIIPGAERRPPPPADLQRKRFALILAPP